MEIFHCPVCKEKLPYFWALGLDKNEAYECEHCGAILQIKKLNLIFRTLFTVLIMVMLNYIINILDQMMPGHKKNSFVLAWFIILAFCTAILPFTNKPVLVENDKGEKRIVNKNGGI